MIRQSYAVFREGIFVGFSYGPDETTALLLWMEMDETPFAFYTVVDAKKAYEEAQITSNDYTGLGKQYLAGG